MEFTRRNVLILALLFLSGLLIACGAFGAASQGGEVKNIYVNQPRPQVSILETEDFPLINCGGSSDLTQTLGSLANVSDTSSIGTTAKASGGEIQVSAAARLEIQAELTKAYQETLSGEQSRTDSILLSAKEGTHIVYKIQWEEYTYSSTISYDSGSEVYDVPYEYKIKIPKVAGSDQLSCNGIEPTQTATTIIQILPIVVTEETCTGAPKQHVTTGQTVKVTVENFDKLKLRSEPRISSNTVIMELNKNTKLVILDGPVCVRAEANTSYWFWKVKVVPTNEQGWIAEGDFSHYFIE
jgi:hypothetical protein